MPLIYINFPAGTFRANALNDLTRDITEIGMKAEGRPDTAFVKSTTWIFAREYTPEEVFVGGVSGGTKIIGLEVNVFEGGVSDESKKFLIAQITSSIQKHLGLPSDARVPVYIIIREIEPSNWGVFGDRITLDSLRNPPEDSQPV